MTQPAAMRWRCVDQLPRAGGGWYAHYEHRDLRAPGWTAWDLRTVIQRHQDEWIDAFDQWHAALGDAALARTPWWWLMPVSRPNLLAQHALLKPLFFAAAACEWRAQHPADDLTLVACPPDVRAYLEEFDQGPDSGDHRPLPPAWKRLKQELGRTWAGLAHVLPYAFRNARGPRGRVLFYSHVVHLDPLKESGDHFFGRMIQIAEQAMPQEVVTGYVAHEGVDRAEAERLLARLGRRATFVLDHLTLGDACWAAVTGFRAGRAVTKVDRDAPPIRLGRWTSRRFVPRYVASLVAGQPPVLELAIYRAMRRLLGRTGARIVVYPYEEKALERGLLRACAEASPAVEALAYTHSVITSTHLALRDRLEPRQNPPQPSRWLTSGERTTAWLAGWGRKPLSRLAAVGSHRHVGSIPGSRPFEERRRGLRVLAAIGPGYELSLLANYFERKPDLGAQDEVLIRAYPYTWKNEQDQDMARLRRASPHVTAARGRLEDQLAWADVVLFSASSIGLEAMLADRLVIYLHLHDACEADPLMGEAACFARCATAGELAQALERARSLPDEAHARERQRQREFASAVFAPVDDARLLAQLRPAQRPLHGQDDRSVPALEPVSA